MFLGFDPGKDKCGLALMGIDRRIYLQKIIVSAHATAEIKLITDRYDLSLLILGDSTTSQSWKQKLNAAFPELRLVLIDEKYTTLEARERYWQIYPPQGLTKLLPHKLRLPPRDIDDVVAIILIERYLSRLIEPFPD